MSSEFFKKVFSDSSRTLLRFLENSGQKIKCLSQNDVVSTTMKKGTPKILSKSISRMPMGSLVGHKKVISHRIFLLYKNTPIFIESYYEKSLNYFFLYKILRQIKFLWPTRLPMGILEIDFERISCVPFFIAVLTPSCCALSIEVIMLKSVLHQKLIQSINFEFTIIK